MADLTQIGDAGETNVIYSICIWRFINGQDHDIPAQNHFTVDVDIKGDSTGCGSGGRRYVY